MGIKMLHPTSGGYILIIYFAAGDHLALLHFAVQYMGQVCVCVYVCVCVWLGCMRVCGVCVMHVCNKYRNSLGMNSFL